MKDVDVCPQCGCEMTQGFDGGNDLLYESCDHVHPLLSRAALAAWWTEHDKRCPGPGKCTERPPERVCSVEFSPPRWLAAAMAERRSAP